MHLAYTKSNLKLYLVYITKYMDPNDDADIDVPDQQALIDAFIAGLAKESDFDF